MIFVVRALFPVTPSGRHREVPKKTTVVFVLLRKKDYANLYFVGYIVGH